MMKKKWFSDKPPVSVKKNWINRGYKDPKFFLTPGLDLPWWREPASASCASPPRALFSALAVILPVLCAACLGFCSIFTTTFFLACSFFYKFNRHLCHGAYWWKNNPVHSGIIPWYVYLSFSIFPACVCLNLIFISFIYHSHTSLSPYPYVWFVFCSLLVTIFFVFFLSSVN